VSDTPDRADPLLAGRLRVLQYVSDGCILFASAVLSLVAGNGWAWGPFVVGPVVVAVATACNEVVIRAGMAMFKPTEEQRRRTRTHRRKRNVIIIPAYVTFAIAAGVIAGSLESYWPDAVLGAIVLITAVALPLALLPRLKRRAEAMRASSSGGA